MERMCAMKITWLGQAGLLFESGGLTVMVDPYLSDSVRQIEPEKGRRVPVREELFAIRPDVMIFTHDHLDHYDPDTAARFLTENAGITVLAPSSVWQKVRFLSGGNRYVQFNRHTTWTEGSIRFTAVKAEHSDPMAIGVILDDGERKYYVTGDTLYNSDIFPDLPEDIHAVFLPVNGEGNNMNMADAKCFCERIRPRVAVPLHCGLFDDIDMNQFGYERKVVPTFYEEIGV